VELVSFLQQAQTNVPDVQEMNLREVQCMILVVVGIATSPFFNNSYESEDTENLGYPSNLE
jgi:hypothetical protein